ncbi:MAG: hypothetical protein WBM28_06880, partial [Burkholderiales bacterium]
MLALLAFAALVRVALRTLFAAGSIRTLLPLRPVGSWGPVAAHVAAWALLVRASLATTTTAMLPV